MNRRGVVRLRVVCESAESGECAGVAKLRLRLPRDAGTAARRRIRTVARKRFEVPAGDSKRVKLRVRRKVRRALAGKRRVRARVVIVVRDEDGARHKFRQNVKLRIARRH